jgi:hypothetical protein
MHIVNVPTLRPQLGLNISIIFCINALSVSYLFIIYFGSTHAELAMIFHFTESTYI